MRLDTEIKLNYEDVLLKPKRSTLSSRRDVEMEREFLFRNSKLKYKCLTCGKEKWMMPLRPSSEISY